MTFGSDAVVVCFCPQGPEGHCVHLRFLDEYSDTHFPNDGAFLESPSECAAIRIAAVLNIF